MNDGNPITNDWMKRADEILCEAIAIEAGAGRDAFVAGACAGDAALADAVGQLFALRDEAEDFFKEGSPSRISAAEISQTLTDIPEFFENMGSVLPDDDDEVGKQIGPYKLLQKIGEGGAGNVYLAQQEEPVRRQVALKIIKLGMDTKSVIARFAAERQALAMMEHPNIAHVLNAGETETGRPFFVMELVHGVRITTYCDEAGLAIRNRLELFIQVCHAIQHAHQKGVIHRDIKPSNVLVSLHDGVPVPKVIDFGIAKATSGDLLTDHTVYTAVEPFIGTPAYMSPEQAQAGGADVDTRSDIYSLGVLLYELLTGKTPFDKKELLKSGLDEMRRTLRECEPPLPSAKLHKMSPEDRERTAKNRACDPRRLEVLSAGDLDWIIMKALEKDRSRRYETADALAMDIERFLNDEPVLARPPSRRYRFRKLVRRNRGVFSAVGTIAVALFIALGSVSWSLMKEKEAREQADVRQKITQAAFAASQGRPEDADRIIRGIHPIPPSIESALTFRALGEWDALNGRLKQASTRFSMLVRMNEFANRDMATRDAAMCGTALAAAGDQQGYDHFRALATARFSESPCALTAERILKATLLLPASKAFLQGLQPYAEAILSQTPAPNLVKHGERIVYPHIEKFAAVSACSFDGNAVGVRFNQRVDPVGATTPSNYQVQGASVTNGVLDADGKTVLLELSSPLRGEFKVTISNVKNRLQESVAPESTLAGAVLNLRWAVVGDARATSNSVACHGNAATIVAGGSDIWIGGDHFAYHYMEVTNDFDYCLRVQSVKDTDGSGYARAGLMARDSLTDLAGHMAMMGRNAGTTAAGSFQMICRTFADQPASIESHPQGSLSLAGGQDSWVRLRRAGTVFTGYYSVNGVDWTRLYEFDGAAAGDRKFTQRVLYLGIATSAHSHAIPTTAVVSDLGATPQEPVKIVSQPAPGIDWRLGSAANLRVVASGSRIAYQWRKNGVDIPGATNGTYRLARVGPTDAGRYSVLVYNEVNSLIAADMTATVRVDAEPPVVSDVISYDGLSVGVLFNKPLDPATATHCANYVIDGTTITNASLMADGQSVVLWVNERLAGRFSVAVRNVQDLAKNTLGTGSKVSGAVLNLQQLAIGDAMEQPFSVRYAGNASTILAGGSDIGTQGDHFVYQYLMVTNDFDFRLQVKSVTGGGGAFARTGLMARDSINHLSSPQVMVAVNEKNTFQVLVRTRTGSSQAQSQPPNPLPQAYGSNSWVRLQRIGTTFYTYGSADGQSWTRLHQFDSTSGEEGPFASTLYLGIATSAWSSKNAVIAQVSDFGVPQTLSANSMLSLALLEYRRGNYGPAMDWTRRCITNPDYQAARVATAHEILALCYQRLRQVDAARSELAKAHGMIDAQSAGEPNPGNATQGFWFDWLAARVLMREAESVVPEN